MSLYNAYTGKLQFIEFRKHVVEQVFEKHSRQIGRSASCCVVDNPTRFVGKSVYKNSITKLLFYISGRHFPSPVPETPGKGKKSRRKCYVCATTMQPEEGKKQNLCVLTVM